MTLPRHPLDGHSRDTTTRPENGGAATASPGWRSVASLGGLLYAGANAAVGSSVHAELPVRILILTTFALDEYVFDAIRAGAGGFLVKDTEPSDLLDAVRAVARGDALHSPGVTRRLIRGVRGPGWAT